MGVQGYEAGLINVLVCESAQTRIGLAFTSVVEIVRVVAMTALPGAPPVVEGMINLRGTVVPVLDLAACIDGRHRAVALTDHLVVARICERAVALRVDRALEIVEVASDSITSAQALRGRASSIVGAVPLQNGLLLLCDLEGFLDAAEQLSLDRALADFCAAEATA
jgi:purine-binding chemotaxis protein CheW